MKSKLGFTVVIGLIVVTTGCATTFEKSPPARALPNGESIAVEGIKYYEYGQGREALEIVEQLVRDHLKGPDGGADLAAHMALLLDSDATLACKQFVCEQLWLVGTRHELPYLAPMLTDPETADMARFALERMPGREVDTSLLDALNVTQGTVRIGIINALGNRQVFRARVPLKALATDPDPATAEAARSAFAKIDAHAEF